MPVKLYAVKNGKINKRQFRLSVVGTFNSNSPMKQEKKIKPRTEQLPSPTDEREELFEMLSQSRMEGTQAVFNFERFRVMYKSKKINEIMMHEMTENREREE